MLVQSSLLALLPTSLQCPVIPLISECIHNCLVTYLPSWVYLMSLHNMSLIYLYGITVFPSIQVFSNESAHCVSWPNYRSFSYSISPCSEYSGLISFRIDWFDLFAVQGTLPGIFSSTESISSSALGLLYGPALTSVHDYWKNNSFDYTDLCQQRDVSDF